MRRRGDIHHAVGLCSAQSSVFLLVLSAVTSTTDGGNAGNFVCTESSCKFHLIIERRQTMTTVIDGDAFDVALDDAGQLKVIDNSFHSAARFRSVVGRWVDPDDALTADGFRRDILTVNGQFPGPTIEVYEGAQASLIHRYIYSIFMHGLIE
jgi:Multicopper oxidase